jgi:hypothetical protein
MTISTPLRIGIGLSIAALAIAGFAAASGQFSSAKATNQAAPFSTAVSSPSMPSERTETRVDARNGTIVTEDYRGKDDQRNDETSVERGERSESRVQTRVDNQSGAVQTQDIRNDDREKRGERAERAERRENGERDDD